MARHRIAKIRLGPFTLFTPSWLDCFCREFSDHINFTFCSDIYVIYSLCFLQYSPHLELQAFASWISRFWECSSTPSSRTPITPSPPSDIPASSSQASQQTEGCPSPSRNRCNETNLPLWWAHLIYGLIHLHYLLVAVVAVATDLATQAGRV